jgi:chromosomal replication initiation ATPase DnaA
LLQLSLPLQISGQTDVFKEEDFCLFSENIDAFNLLKKFLSQKDFSTAQFQSLILKGGEACGKTHMLQVLSKKFSIEFLEKAEIFDLNLSEVFIKNKFYVLEDIEKITDEKSLFHLLNYAVEAKIFLILSSIDKADFKLKDLVSRLKNIYNIEIKNPNLETVKLLLLNLFSRRQIKLSKAIIDYIADNIDRSYFEILIAVKKVDFYLQENSGNLTLKKIKTMFKSAK